MIILNFIQQAPSRIRAIENFGFMSGIRQTPRRAFLIVAARFYCGRVMWRNEFDPEDLKQICDCFDMAWNFVEQSATGMFPEPALSREILAVQIFGFAKQGETDKIRIVNLALGHLRQVAQRDRSQQRVRARIASAA
jgi:hypothetical protein